jgi:hemolysin activation/secretion protein
MYGMSQWNHWLIKATQLFLFFVFTFIISDNVFAADVRVGAVLPGSVQPGVISQYVTPKNNYTPKSAPKVLSPEEQAASFGPQAEHIKFTLRQIILQGNHVYSNAELEALYKDKINKNISIAELQDIVQNITNYYRNNGYILSRAILPPQHVNNGVVHITIIEGYISKVTVIGKANGARQILVAYGNKIVQSRPLQIKIMEHYLLLANQLPGVDVKAILEPSKTETGASDLNLAVKEQTVNASFSYDNYGTLYIGPLQTTASTSVNSIFRSGDTTRFTTLGTTHGSELDFYDLFYQTPLWDNGLQGTLDANKSYTTPGLNLRPLKVDGTSTSYTAGMQYPLLRSRAANATLDGSFVYSNSQTTQFGFNLYNDHIRYVRFGGTTDFADRFSGINLISAHAEQGLNVLGASDNPNSTTSSRFGADGIYSKFTMQASRTQALFNQFSAYVLASGQYAFNPLLTTVQFGFGGSQLGRGYDPAEILGDRGLAGSAELRYDMAPDKVFLKNVQLYAFYDIGVVWDIKEVIGIPLRQDAASTGFGSRFAINKYLSGNVMWTQPLTKEVAAEEIIGEGHRPRVFFSLVAAI